MNALQQLRSTLKNSIGITIPQGSADVLQRAMAKCMKLRGVQEAKNYLELLRADPEELDNLIEHVVVPETWFFRNSESFVALAKWASEWRKHHSRCMEALSIPCSTGEEPYSIAITLLDAGFDPEHLRIVGGDISRLALEIAKEAVYFKKSFRDESAFRKKYFKISGEKYILNKEIQSLVRLKQMNVFDDHFSKKGKMWDVIFCRNLLIYFDEDHQLQALKKIHAMLADDGILFLGPVEPPIARKAGFYPLRYPMAFACSKREMPIKNSSSIRISPQKAIPTARSVLASSLKSKKLKASPLQEDISSPVKTDWQHILLEQARDRADAGDLQTAAALLESCLCSSEATAEDYFLAGVIQDSLKRPLVAESYYRKALYLNPAHYDALMHLSLLLEIQRRNKEANRLRLRAKKAVSA